jgi:excisionase family DNA binding protein
MELYYPHEPKEERPLTTGPGIEEEAVGVPDEPREVLNADQAADFLGLNPYTVREKARAGEIPGRKVGKEWRFLRSALLEWLGGERDA